MDGNNCHQVSLCLMACWCEAPDLSFWFIADGQFLVTNWHKVVTAQKCCPEYCADKGRRYIRSFAYLYSTGSQAKPQRYFVHKTYYFATQEDMYTLPHLREFLFCQWNFSQTLSNSLATSRIPNPLATHAKLIWQLACPEESRNENLIFY